MRNFDYIQITSNHQIQRKSGCAIRIVQYGGKGPDAEYSSAELKQVFTTAASLQIESAVNIGWRRLVWQFGRVRMMQSIEAKHLLQADH